MLHMEGSLVRYGGASRLSALLARRTAGPRCIGARPSAGLVNVELQPPRSGLAVIFLPGLTDGLLALDYVAPLDAMLASMHVALVQPLLSSSYNGYGTSSLSKDVGELDELIDQLDSALGFEDTQFVLWGHSTGAQISVMYARRGRHRSRLAGVVLQGAVSDRDFAEASDATGQLPDWLAHASASLRQRRKDEDQPDLMPRSAYPDAPISPERFLSLFGRGGPDDCFSHDLTPAELRLKLQHLSRVGSGSSTTSSSGSNNNSRSSSNNTSGRDSHVDDSNNSRVLFFFSEEDEYMPHAKEEARALGLRIAAAAGGHAQAVFLEGADHAVSSAAAQAAMLRRAQTLFRQVVAAIEPPLWWRTVVAGVKVTAVLLAALAVALVVLIVLRVGAATTNATAQYDTDSDGVLSLGEAAARTVSDPIQLVRKAAVDGDASAAVAAATAAAAAAAAEAAEVAAAEVSGLEDGGCSGDCAAVCSDAESGAHGHWTTGEVLTAFAVYAAASVPLVLVGVRLAGRRVRDSWLQEGRRRYQKEMLQAVAS